jgi:hypothetical protein
MPSHKRGCSTAEKRAGPAPPCYRSGRGRSRPAVPGSHPSLADPRPGRSTGPAAPMVNHPSSRLPRRSCRAVRPLEKSVRPERRTVGPLRRVVRPPRPAVGRGGRVSGPGRRVMRPPRPVVGPPRRVVRPSRPAVGRGRRVSGPGRRAGRLGGPALSRAGRIVFSSGWTEISAADPALGASRLNRTQGHQHS